MDAIEHLLSRGVDTIYPSRDALEKVLRSGKKLRLYQGFDPTGAQLHIGHAVALRKLRQWQDLGHHVIFLIGDGTGQAGDPSGKMKSREKFFNREELRQNARDYVMQASKILRFTGENPVEILYNGDWLNKLGLVEILDLAGNFSVQQFIERDMYQERMKRKETINLREFLYPILQGYDSVAMKVDVELGGTDQTFNMLIGRTLVAKYLNKEKFVMTVPLLTDAKGVKIGKTEGNVIGITDPPNEFYGKIMALGDDAIIPCFTLLTDRSHEDITAMKQKMAQGENPMVFKKKLAFELTEQFNSKEAAETAQEEFETRFQKGQLSQSSLPTVSVTEFGKFSTLSQALTGTKTVSSRAEAKRLLDQNAIEINGKIITEDGKPDLKPGDTIKIGKKKGIKII